MAKSPGKSKLVVRVVVAICLLIAFGEDKGEGLQPTDAGEFSHSGRERLPYLVLIVACVVALFAWKGCQPDNPGMNLKPFDEPLKLPEH